MKIVITLHTEFDYECGSHTYYRAGEVESIEAFYCAFMDRKKEIEDYQKEYDKKSKTFANKHSYQSAENIFLWREFDKENPSPHDKYSRFEVYGILFDFGDIKNFDENQIYTLDQWFEIVCSGNDP